MLFRSRTINGTASVTDRVHALTEDTAGDVVAAGFTSNVGTGWDLTVVKLRGADGADFVASTTSTTLLATTTTAPPVTTTTGPPVTTTTTDTPTSTTLTVPSTTSTTSVPSTTTSTTMTLPVSSTTTLTITTTTTNKDATTTSTVAAVSCPALPTLPSIDCRFEVLSSELRTLLPVGRVGSALSAESAKGVLWIHQAEIALRQGSRRRARNVLGREQRALVRLGRYLRSPKVRKAAVGDLGPSLQSAEQLRSDVGTLRRSL